MHSLRSTLGKQSEESQASMSGKLPSKLTNKSKNGSIWAIDPDDDDDDLSGQGQPKQKNKLKSYIEIALNSAFKNDPNFTQMCFFEVMEQIQSKNPTNNQLQCLLAVEQKIHEFQKTADQQLADFLSAFNESIIKRIKKLRKKEKKNQLEEYDKIVRNNFKKKGAVEYIDQQEPRKNMLQVKEQQFARKFGSKDVNEGSSRKNGSGSSSEGKLGKLLSNTKLKDDKKEVNMQENQQGHEESISFSAIVSQSVTVRSRNHKQVPKPKKEKQQPAVKKGKEQSEKDNEDEAFMFFRPKASKKK